LFEKDLAFSLIDAKKELLESKKTDSVALMNKKQAWADLADQFNTVTGVSKRSGPQLQCWWDNQKKRARRNIADNRVKILLPAAAHILRLLTPGMTRLPALLHRHSFHYRMTSTLMLHISIAL